MSSIIALVVLLFMNVQVHGAFIPSPIASISVYVPGQSVGGFGASMEPGSTATGYPISPAVYPSALESPTTSLAVSTSSQGFSTTSVYVTVAPEMTSSSEATSDSCLTTLTSTVVVVLTAKHTLTSAPVALTFVPIASTSTPVATTSATAESTLNGANVQTSSQVLTPTQASQIFTPINVPTTTMASTTYASTVVEAAYASSTPFYTVPNNATYSYVGATGNASESTVASTTARTSQSIATGGTPQFLGFGLGTLVKAEVLLSLLVLLI